MKFKLRDYQQDAVNAVLSWVKQSTSSCVIDLPTGAGKSLVVAEIARNIHLASKKKVLCLAPSKELVQQNAEKYRLTGNSCSIFSASAGSKDTTHFVVFGSPKTVKNSIDKFGSQYAAVIIDECLTGDSLIDTSEGLMRIDDPEIKNKYIKCIDEDSGSIYYHKPNKVWNNGIKSVSLIKTSIGEIKCTENHLLHCEGSWIYSKNVKIGQRLTFDGSKDFVMRKLLRAVAAVVKRLMF